jgi:uncharacterized membrane protein YdbT with pleckstrin-like domain
MQEKTLYEAHPVMFRNQPIQFVVVSVLSIALVGLPILLVWWLQCKAAKLTVTTERTIMRKGLLSKHTNEVYHSDIRNIQVRQSLFQRMFRTGAVAVSSAGQGGVEIDFSGLPEVESVRQIIDAQRRQQRQPAVAA